MCGVCVLTGHTKKALLHLFHAPPATRRIHISDPLARPYLVFRAEEVKLAAHIINFGFTPDPVIIEVVYEWLLQAATSPPISEILVALQILELTRVKGLDLVVSIIVMLHYSFDRAWFLAFLFLGLYLSEVE